MQIYERLLWNVILALSVLLAWVQISYVKIERSVHHAGAISTVPEPITGLKIVDLPPPLVIF